MYDDKMWSRLKDLIECAIKERCFPCFRHDDWDWWAEKTCELLMCVSDLKGYRCWIQRSNCMIWR